MNQQLSEILWNTLEVAPPLEIKQPERGFNGYLLRCNALENEKGKHTFIIKEPDSNFKFDVLPEDYEKRIEIRKKWYKMCDSKRYVAVLIEPREEKYDIFCETLKSMKEQDYIDITMDYVMSICSQWLPSFDIFAAVWHVGQISENGNFRPPHIHLLFKKVRKMTKAQNDIIITE